MAVRLLIQLAALKYKIRPAEPEECKSEQNRGAPDRAQTEILAQKRRNDAACDKHTEHSEVHPQAKCRFRSSVTCIDHEVCAKLTHVVRTECRCHWDSFSLPECIVLHGADKIQGDLADLKVKSLDVEAWSPRQKKYFEVGSCSNLGDAQARRLGIRVKGKDGRKYLAHTLNNTVVAPPRMLIAFLENNLNADGSVNIPKALQPYMGGQEKIEKK